MIFLCLERPFKKSLPVYFFENTCRDNPELKLNDRAYKVFFNASEYDKITKINILRLQVYAVFHKVENGSLATKHKLEEQALLAARK